LTKWAATEIAGKLRGTSFDHVRMAAIVDILSDDHLEKFYREHVAGKTSLDDDIRAIEEEIDK